MAGKKNINKREADDIRPKFQIIPYNPLFRYLQEIKKYPILTREKEQELTHHYFVYKDNEAAFKLVTSNLLLVVKLVMEFRTKQQNLLDLIQEGNIGLIEALDRFDPYRNTRFSTYASWWIRAYILKYLLDNWRIVKFGTSNKKRKLFYNLKKEKAKLEAMGIHPGPKQLAEKLGATETEIIDMTQNIEQGDFSLETTRDEDRDSPLIEILADDSISPEDKTIREEFLLLVKEKIAEFQKGLDERERVILEKRLLADKPATLQQIADRFKKTREAIRYTENKIIKGLKKFLSKEIPDLKLDFISKKTKKD